MDRTNCVNENMILNVSKNIDCPLIVGGGLNTIEKIELAFENGADIVVIGNAVEKNQKYFKSNRKNQKIVIEQIEFIAVTLSIIYVILASRENHNCWYFGILSVSVYIYICLDALLYAETLLQIVYLFLSFYGLYNWKKNLLSMNH